MIRYQKPGGRVPLVRVKHSTNDDRSVPQGYGNGVDGKERNTVNGRGNTGKKVSWRDQNGNVPGHGLTE